MTLFLSSSCVGVEEDAAADIDLYHCPNCQPLHGPSVSKLWPCCDSLSLSLVLEDRP